MAPSKKLKVNDAISSAKAALDKDGASDSLKESMNVVFDMLLTVTNFLGLNSQNSSKPPSTDPFRPRKTRRAKGRKRKPGGQKGHKGTYLRPVEKPNETEQILVDRESLPPGKYEHVGFEKRQVFDVEVSCHVIEYQAEILRNKKGIEFVADFPVGVTESAQYGSTVKATSVYLSQGQLLPQARVQDVFHTQFGLPLAKGSVNNFNILAANTLRELRFEDWLTKEAIVSPRLNADETGTNVNGNRFWIHCLCNEKLTYFFVDPKRGKDAMDRMGVLPYFKGQLVHDHWKPYFKYLCTHSLCNAHHLRELERAFEQDGQQWAKKMMALLLELNVAVKEKELKDRDIVRYHKRYQKILINADKECPANLRQRAQSKSRNLLERLFAFEEETLRFMDNSIVPFTNNQGERDLRMNKVQQKISGCFRSMRGAKDFCLIRSYLSTCRKNGIHHMEALKLLFERKLPDFMS